MDTQFLRTFVSVVDNGSMAAAARLLNITPAAVAQQIRTLERQIGTPLIARAGRTVSVTEAGARILERARELLRDVDDLRSGRQRRRQFAGELRLGAGTTALTGMLPDILARMVARFPQISVFIKPGYSADLYRAVESGELDAAVVLEAPFALHKTCGWELLREEPLVVLAPQSMAGSRSARTARDAAADPLRPQSMGRAQGGRISAHGRNHAARTLRAERVERDRGDGRSRPRRVAGAGLGAAVAGRIATGAHSVAACVRAAPHRHRLVARVDPHPAGECIRRRGARGEPVRSWQRTSSKSNKK